MLTFTRTKKDSGDENENKPIREIRPGHSNKIAYSQAYSTELKGVRLSVACVELLLVL